MLAMNMLMIVLISILLIFFLIFSMLIPFYEASISKNTSQAKLIPVCEQNEALLLFS